ncbi:MAG: nuclear transport factor 2 family protein [Cyanobacteria bacterium SID2]|nr:nuclear transport factor 2 family protein [Cyanobacteria bacterium SID2]MBP0006109.1 nuclear transport factor 2 family protein [Cyanobacteria bacterium SBC]
MTSDRQAILNANQNFYRAFEKKDIVALENVCSQGTEATCIHPGRDVLRGWNAIRNSWEQIFSATQYLEIETEVLSVEVSGDLAVVVLVETVLQAGRGRRMKAKSIATNVFNQMSGRWFLIHHHGSPILS